ncbi:MAG: hypothetical protein ABI574_00910 [Burkholderiales bacterium]
MSRLTAAAGAALRALIGNFCFTKITLAINAASAATVKSTGAIVYTIGGLFFTKSALAAQSIAVTHRLFGEPVTVADPAFVQPSGTTVFYVLSLNAAGTVAVSQGSYAGQAVTYAGDLSRIVTGDGDLPEEPAGYTAIGVLKVATTGGATFTPGTTALDAANVAVTYYDVATLPETL